MDTFNPVSFAQTFAEIKKRREEKMRQQEQENEQTAKQKRMAEQQAADNKKYEEEKAKEAERIEFLKKEYHDKKPEPEPEFKSQVVSPKVAAADMMAYRSKLYKEREEAKPLTQRIQEKKDLIEYLKKWNKERATDKESIKANKDWIKEIKKEIDELTSSVTTTTTTTVIKPNKAENYTPENAQSEDSRSTSYKGNFPAVVGDGVTAEAPIEHEVMSPLVDAAWRNDIGAFIDAYEEKHKNERGYKRLTNEAAMKLMPSFKPKKRTAYEAIDAKAPPVANEALSAALGDKLAKKQKLQSLRDSISELKTSGILSRKASRARIKDASKIGADDFAFGNDHAGLTDIDTRLNSLLHRSRVSDTVKDDSGAIRRLDKDDISNYGLKPNLAANNQGEFDEDEVDAYKADIDEFGLRPVKKYTKKDKATGNNITYYYYVDEGKDTATTEKQDPDKKRDYDLYREGKVAKVVTAGMAYKPEVATAINNHAIGKVLEYLENAGVDLRDIDELDLNLSPDLLDKIVNYRPSPLDSDIDDFVEDIVINGNKDSNQRKMFFNVYTGALDNLTNRLNVALRSADRNLAAEDYRNANNTWKILDKEDWSNTMKAARDKAGKQAKTIKAVDEHPGGYNNLITYNGNAMLGKMTEYNSKEFGGKFPEFDGVPVMVYYPAIKNQYNTEFKKLDMTDEDDKKERARLEQEIERIKRGDLTDAEKIEREDKIIRGEDPDKELNLALEKLMPQTVMKYTSDADKAIDSYVALSDADPLLVMPIGNDENYIAKSKDDAINKAKNWLETQIGHIEPHYTARFGRYKDAVAAHNADTILKQFPGPGGFDAWYKKTAGTGKDITSALYDLKANKSMDARFNQLKKWGLDVNKDDWSIHPADMFEQGGPLEGKGLVALNSETRQNALANWIQQLPTNSYLYTSVGNHLKTVEDKIKKVEENGALSFDEKNKLLSNLYDARNKIMQAYRGALGPDDKTTHEDDNPYTKANQRPSLSYGRGLVDFGSKHGKAATIAADYNQLADYTNGLTRDQIDKEADVMNNLNNKEVAELRDKSRQPSTKKTVVKPIKKLTAKEVMEREEQAEKARNSEKASNTVGAIVHKKDVKRDINEVVNSLTSEQQETLAAMSPEELQRLIAIVQQGQAPSK